MIGPFQQVVDELEHTFRLLELQVPPPALAAKEGGFTLRYQEKTPQQAALMKLARYISGLHAIAILLEHGFCQEMGVLQRTLDDIEEDLWFLMLGLKDGEWTDNHDKYLEYFWMEEPGAGMVSRDKIRAYVHRTGGHPDPSTGIDTGRALFKAYSGYVHAGSVAIVDMCAGDPPRFHLAGMLHNPLYADHVEDAWNPFYRGLVCGVLTARIIGDDDIWQDRYHSLKGFEKQFAEKIFPVSGG
jgi:hypothetical protein